MTREFSDAGSLANECAEYRLVPTDRRQGFQEEFLILVTVHGTNAQDNARTARTGESECGGDLIAIVTIIGRRGRLGGQTARNHLDTPDNKAHGRELSTRGLRRRHDRINLGHDGEIGGGLFRRLDRPRRLPSNAEIGHLLDRVADLLEVQGANAFRIRAYRHAAQTVRESVVSVAELAMNEPPRALHDLPAIGSSIGSAI